MKQGGTRRFDTESAGEKLKPTTEEADRSEEQQNRVRWRFLGRAPRSAAHSRKINSSHFCFCYSSLQITPRLQGNSCTATSTPRPNQDKHHTLWTFFHLATRHSTARLMKQIRHRNYNHKEVFIKPFFCFFQLVIAAPTRVFTKTWRFCRKVW